MVPHTAHMAGNFLQRSRHGTTYFFRRRVPQDVQHILKLTQVFRSLATADRREAIVRARVLAAHTDRLADQPKGELSGIANLNCALECSKAFVALIASIKASTFEKSKAVVQPCMRMRALMKPEGLF